MAWAFAPAVIHEGRATDVNAPHVGNESTRRLVVVRAHHYDRITQLVVMLGPVAQSVRRHQGRGETSAAASKQTSVPFIEIADLGQVLTL